MVRLLRSGLSRPDVLPRLRDIVSRLFESVPTGVGSSRRDLKLSPKELSRVLRDGAAWAVARGYGRQDDLERLEEGGCLPGADPSLVSARALERGASQLGTLGSGNHFAESNTWPRSTTTRPPPRSACGWTRSP